MIMLLHFQGDTCIDALSPRHSFVLWANSPYGALFAELAKPELLSKTTMQSRQMIKKLHVIHTLTSNDYFSRLSAIISYNINTFSG